MYYRHFHVFAVAHKQKTLQICTTKNHNKIFERWSPLGYNGYHGDILVATITMATKSVFWVTMATKDINSVSMATMQARI